MNKYEKIMTESRKLLDDTRQTIYLKSIGLKPYHYFLEIGCGRLLPNGVTFINYLNNNRYYGIDKEVGELGFQTAYEILKKYDFLSQKNPKLFNTPNFDIYSFTKEKFDYIWAQSVFTHIPLESIEKCIKNIIPSLNHGGSFYATFWLNEKIILKDIHLDRVNEFKRSEHPFECYKEICKDVCNVEYIGDWNHPSDQKLLRFWR